MNTRNPTVSRWRRYSLTTLCLLPLQSAAEQYLGEFCWDIQESSATEVTGALRIGVWRDQGSFSVRGTLTDTSLGGTDGGGGSGGSVLPDQTADSSADPITLIVDGSADVLPAGASEDSKVSIGLHGSSAVLFAQINLMLDPNTLDGSASAVVFRTQPSLSTQAWEGEAALARCQ